MRTLSLSSYFVSLLLSFALFSTTASAGPEEVYKESLQLAAKGDERSAIAALRAAAAMLPPEQPWQTRMIAAAKLLELKLNRQDYPDTDQDNAYLMLGRVYAQNSIQPAPSSTMAITVAATLLPGTGHLLQGRGADAATAALMVWPMLFLCLWAAKRRMGPVTLFFALITVWLWSGTLFSAISLAERGDVELYLTWWQGLWQASGLPGRPW